MEATELTARVATQIADYIRAGHAPEGTLLVERKLADQLRVSRSPVRNALRVLQTEGIVGAPERGGYVVLKPIQDIRPRPQPPASDEEIYGKVTEDRLSGGLPDKVTENTLVRRYGLTRVQLAKVLRRIAGEGWIERLPGRGWAFLPLLTSAQAYEDSYRFRLVIEPAAILDPGFELKHPALEECCREQQSLVAGRIWTVSDAELLELNSQIHQLVIECSHNAFFRDNLKRIDTLRRIREFRQSIDRDYAVVRCREHLQIARLLLAAKRGDAADLMRRHLASVSSARMARQEPRSGEWPTSVARVGHAPFWATSHDG